MSSLFVTAENIRILKAELARVLPDVKSSHRIEALASALGFRTYAAMLASQQAAEARRPLFLQLDATRFSERLQSLGYLYDPGMFGHLAHFADLVDKPWVVLPRDNLTAIDRWFRDCGQRGVPTMYIAPRRKYARLEWDCITIPAGEDKHALNRDGNALGRAMKQVFNSMPQAEGRPFYEASCYVGHVDGLMPEIAGDMADAFFHMLYDPLRRPLFGSAA